MNDKKDLREIGKYSNDTTKAVLEMLQEGRAASDWPHLVTNGLSTVWRGCENQNYIDDIWAAMEQVDRSEEVVAWAFSDANDDLIGAAILAVWAFQRSGSRRVIQIVARSVGTMPAALRSTFIAFYKAYIEKAAWKLSGSGAWVCHPDDPGRECQEREQQSENNRRFCEISDIERLVAAWVPPPEAANIVTATATDAHDIFISYRRDGGEHLAGRVKDALKGRGFSVFMDVEDLKSGKFDEALLAKIEAATDFIAILTLGCLERCRNEDDWLRQEIRHAIRCRRNVVPVLARGFEMPTPRALPSDIAELPKYSGLTPVHQLFDASIDKLVSTFLKSRKRDITSAPAQDIILAETKSQQLARLFKERPDVIAEVEAEAAMIPNDIAVQLEKLLLHLETVVCTPLHPNNSWNESEDDRNRFFELIESTDSQCEEAHQLLLASRRNDISAEEWKHLYSEYRHRIGTKTEVKRQIMMLGNNILPAILLSFKRFAQSEAQKSPGSGWHFTWKMDVELADLLAHFGDSRALTFIAEAFIHNESGLCETSAWGQHIAKVWRTAMAQTALRLGVDRITFGECLRRLIDLDSSGNNTLRY